MAIAVPPQLAIKKALDNIGVKNGTALNEMSAPVGYSNEMAEKWHNERQAMYELLVAQQIAAAGEKRVKDAKEEMNKLFPLLETIKVGASTGIVRGNVSMNVERRNAASRLDVALLTSALAKRGLDLSDVEAIISEASKASKPPTYYKPTIIIDQG